MIIFTSISSISSKLRLRVSTRLRFCSVPVLFILPLSAPSNRVPSSELRDNSNHKSDHFRLNWGSTFFSDITIIMLSLTFTNVNLKTVFMTSTSKTPRPPSLSLLLSFLPKVSVYFVRKFQIRNIYKF